MQKDRRALTNIVSFPTVHLSNTRLAPALQTGDGAHATTTNKSTGAGYLHTFPQAPLITTTTTTIISPMANNTHEDMFSALPASAMEYTPNTASSGSYAHMYGHGGSAAMRNSSNNTRNHSIHTYGDDDTVQGYSVHTPPLTVMYAASPAQTVDMRTLATRPAVIQLAAPPPPRAHRRRADAGLGLDSGVLHGHTTFSQAGSLAGTRSSGSHAHEPPLARNAGVHEGVPSRKSDAYAYGYEAPGAEQSFLLETTDALRLSSSVEADASLEGEVSLERMYEEELEEGPADNLEQSGGLHLSRASPISIPVGTRTRVRPNSVPRRLTATSVTHSRNNSIRNNDHKNTRQSEIVTLTTPRAKKGPVVDDPSAYIHKRGSLPVASPARKFFGWEFGWDAAPATVGGPDVMRSKTAKKSASMRELREREDDEASFIDLRGNRGFGRGLSLSGSTKDGRKTKRQSLLSGMIPMGGVEEVEGVDRSGEGHSSIVRRLTKRAQAQLASKPDKQTTTVSVSPTAHSHSSSHPRRFSFMVDNVNTKAAAVPAVPESPAALAFCLGRGFGRAHRARHSGPSEVAGSEGNEAPARAMQLKNFKLGVGRTMGPGLTLAVASSLPTDDSSAVEEWRGHYENETEENRALGRKLTAETIREDESLERDDSQEGYGDEDGDEEGEIQSIAAARLVSASIARSTPAATILAAPSTPSRSGYRTSYSSMPSGYSLSPTQEAMSIPQTPSGLPALSALVTAGLVSPTSLVQSPISAEASCLGTKTQPTSRDMWKPHPFADPSDESELPLRSPVRAEPRAVVGGGEREDDVVRLEHEMEEMGASDSLEADSEKALLEFHAVLNQVSARPLSDSGKAENRTLGRTSGHAQTRTSLSAPPVPKPDWAPQALTTPGGFSYRFPIIFGSSTGSSASGSPQRPHVPLSPANSNQQNSTLSTPRGHSTIRLPTRTMDSVRNAFAGVGARMSRMSVVANSIGSPARSGGESGSGLVGGSVSEDSDGDFMDLRDPFASPPHVAKISSANTKMMKADPSSVSSKDWSDNFLVIDAAYGADEGERSTGGGGGSRGEGRTRRRMSAWGRLPMPVRTLSPVPSSAGGASVTTATGKRSSFGSKAATRTVRGKLATRKGKKERRSRKMTLPSMAGALVLTKPGATQAGEEDADFGLEEALLSQRLLKRLDSAEWEIRG